VDPIKVSLLAVIGYFIGSVSSARLIVRIVSPGTKVNEKFEVGLEGSDKKLVLGTVSASWVSAHLGAKFGFLTYVLDVLKIVIPGLVIKAVWPGPYFLVAAAAAVAGHCWPAYYRFKGGRGISAIYGGLFLIDWIGVFICSFGGMALGLLVFRDVLTAYMAGVLLIIPWVWFRTHSLAVLVYALVVNLFFLIAMRPEIGNWRRIKREDKWNDPAEVIQLSGMGRGLLKMGRKLGIIKMKRSETAGRPPD
jgi:acyl phosphate:glycerol-3-phosphate acyltransferase